MTVSVSDYVGVMGVEERNRKIPLIATAIAFNASIVENWEGKDGLYGVEMGSKRFVVNARDFDIANALSKEIKSRMIDREGIQQEYLSPSNVIDVVDIAQMLLSSKTDERSGKKGILVLKDQSGSGWWRVNLPAQYMDADGWYMDITSGSADMDRCMEYDTVVVQRLHSWEQYYTLRKIKDSGRRVIYDIDDDLSSIPPSNRAFYEVGNDGWKAASACMRLADVVTTSTPYLGDRMKQLVGIDPIVIPNAWNSDDNWLPTNEIGSPDGYKRILWQGGSTHKEDWAECADAVIEVFKNREDVKLVILGYFPQEILPLLDNPANGERIEYVNFNDVETYYEILHHVRADVGLAPLENNQFNLSKSNCKWIEYSCVGVPIVASDIGPYSDIKNGVDGVLVKSYDGWLDAINRLLDSPEDGRRIVGSARERVAKNYDIRNTALIWQNVFIGEGI